MKLPRCLVLFTSVFIAFLLLLAPASAGSKTEYDPHSLHTVDPKHYPSFLDHVPRASLEEAIVQSLDYLDAVSPERSFRFGGNIFSAAWLAESLRFFLAAVRTAPTSQALQQIVRENFRVYQAGGASDGQDLLVTGYYEPLFNGSLRKGDGFNHPLYSPPPDLVRERDQDGTVRTGRYEKGRLVPYWSRRELEEKNLLRGRELVYVKSAVDAFVLQVQGSGRISLPDGTVRKIRFAAKNGRPYRSIGRCLVEQGKMKLEEVTMPRIRSYLEEHPDECRTILYNNESFVFFRWGDDGAAGPAGCLGRPLTPLRSIALDHQVFPPGALAFLETLQPDIDGRGRIVSWSPLSLFVLNQDTGSAIKGPDRVDLFWGSGEHAATAAGHMKHRGKLYFLVKKENGPAGAP